MTKRGELRSLQSLPNHTRSLVTPLLMAHPVEWDFDNDSPKKSVDDHLQPIPANIASHWGKSTAFIDLKWIDDDNLASGVHPLRWLFDEAAKLGLDLIPVVGPERSDAYISAVHDIVQTYGTDVCLRLAPDYWPGFSGSPECGKLISRFGIANSKVHVVLDVESDTGGTTRAAVLAELRLNADITAYASVTFAGTGRPVDLPPKKGIHLLDRDEWAIYEAVRKAAPPRIPSFGDYGIAPIETTPINPRFMYISGKLTYTSGSSWIFARGALFRGPAGKSMGGDSVIEPCKLLVGHTGFAGASHCEFDTWIEGVANGTQAGSSPETWLKLGTLHHIVTVTDQIASLGGTLTVP